MPITKEQLAKMIDHTALRPDTSKYEILKLCREAEKHNFATVCVNPVYVPLAAQNLKDTSVKVGTVIGFPFGAIPSSAKAFETKVAAEEGAEEFDMVLNIGALKSRDYLFTSSIFKRSNDCKKRR